MDTELGPRDVIGGVDTHKDTHTVAALAVTGHLLATATFAASAEGYGALLAWRQRFGRVARIGVEGTGSYGAGLTRWLRAARVAVVEINRPNRQTRRRRGKSDPADAEAAARTALAGDGVGTPKAQDGRVEVVRLLRLQRRSAIKARTQAANQLHAVLTTAPDAVRAELRDLPLDRLIARASRFRGVAATTLDGATELVLRGLATRWRQLDEEVEELDAELAVRVQDLAPGLVARQGIGVDVAGALLVTAGDNPERLTHEASFAALCGVAPVDASSGRQHRHRLNRGGDRVANHALWVIALVRMRCDARTRTYVARRTKEGLSTKEILRCLKRYIAREVVRELRSSPAAPSPRAACSDPGG